MKDMEKLTNVIKDGNTLTIKNCNHPRCVSEFLWKVKDTLNQGYRDIVIKSSATSYFPNACVPIAGIIDYYRKGGIDFTYEVDPNCYLAKCGVFNPYKESEDILATEKSPFDKIFYYESPTQVAAITQAYIDSISHQSLCEEGVLTGLIWCLNEVMDNVLTHSSSSFGLVMAQYHPGNNHIVFCIYDYGVGIYKTMSESKHRARTEIDAISLAIQEGVGDGKGQGNGLYGLFETVRGNGGSLTITSGKSSLMLFQDGKVKKFDFIPFISPEHKGTIIDFQLDLNKQIDIKKVFSTIGGFDGFDIRLDNMLDDSNHLIYDIFKNGQGTATRESGKYLRVDIENTLIRNPSTIILDFANVKAVSSSFIDELIAKMVLDLGFVKFNAAVRLANMTDEIAFLCNRSLYMRIHDSWESSKES